LGESLSEIDGLEIRKNYSLSRFTSIGTGGRTKIYVSVARVGALKKSMKLIKEPFFILGSGTNLLISDRDFPGVIIHLGCGFRRLRMEGDRISCGAAVPLARLVKKAIENSFAGFELASGATSIVDPTVTNKEQTLTLSKHFFHPSLYLLADSWILHNEGRFVIGHRSRRQTFSKTILHKTSDAHDWMGAEASTLALLQPHRLQLQHALCGRAGPQD